LHGKGLKDGYLIFNKVNVWDILSSPPQLTCCKYTNEKSPGKNRGMINFILKT